MTTLTDTSLATRIDLLDHFCDVTVAGLLAGLRAAEPEAGWELTRHDPDTRYYASYANRAGEGFSASLHQWDRRIEFSGTFGPLPNGTTWWPSERARGMANPTPTVSAGKAAVQMVADLRRRLFPAYRLVLAEYRRQCAAQAAHRATVTEALTRIVAASRGQLTARPTQIHQTGEIATTAQFPYLGYDAVVPIISGDVTASGDDYEITLRLSHAAGVALVDWLTSTFAREVR